MKLANIILFSLLSLVFAACSSEPPKPDPGRCFVHTDCGGGMECVNTRCQDLYYPKNKIRQK